jgi:hypothetical protein
VTIGDANSGATDTLTISLSGAGVLAGNGLSGSNGVYVLSGTAPAITSELDALTFTPVDGVPNTSVTTAFTLSDTSSAYATATTDTTTTVIDTDPPVAPTITGTVANQRTSSETPVNPFSGVTIADANSGATDILTISLSGAGILAGSGLSGSNGVYVLSGTAAAVTSELDALTFLPVGGVPNRVDATTCTLSDTSSAYGTPAVDSTTTVIDTDPSVPPSIVVPVPVVVQTAEGAPVSAFVSVSIDDPNVNATDVLTITPSGPGLLTGAGLSDSNGVYTLSGTAATITTELDGLLFTPPSDSQQSTVFALTDLSSANATLASNLITVDDYDSIVGPTGSNTASPDGSHRTKGKLADGDDTTAGGGQIRQFAIGTDGNDVQIGTAGDDTLSANSNTNTLVGNGGYDTYKIGPNAGQTTIYNAASDGVTGPAGEVDFGTGISSSQLWFAQNGDNLDIDLLGTKRQITINDWFDNPRAEVQSFNTADGSKLAQIGQLVAAMATFGANNPGFDPATATQMPSDPTLQGVIAAAWHH